MYGRRNPRTLCRILLGLVGLLTPVPLAWAQEKTTVPPGTPVTITVTPTPAAAPKVLINLLGRHGHAHPHRAGFTHTGGGNIDVQQPAADTLVITMTGVCVAGAHPTKNSHATFDFDLDQCFEVSFDDPKVKRAKLTVEGRVVGLLRSHSKGGGTAEQGQACASVCAQDGGEVLTLCVDPHGVGCGENVSVNCRAGPVSAPVLAGKYTLHQTFRIAAGHSRSVLPCKAASAEFAPDPALDPLWISYWEPFHGVAKKDLGFQIAVKVADDTDTTEPKKP